MRCLTSKRLSWAACSLVLTHLTPFQLSVGVRGGCDSVSHILEDLSIAADDKWVLQIDFTKLMHLTIIISRKMTFTEIRAHVPFIASWMEAYYTLQPSLRLGYNHLRSCCGVEKGDPLEPLGFALTLQPIVEEIEQRVPGLKMNKCYLDDGTLCGSSADLAAGLANIAEMEPSRGLLLNYSKCVIFLPTGADPTLSSLPANIPVVHFGLLFVSILS